MATHALCLDLAGLQHQFPDVDILLFFTSFSEAELNLGASARAAGVLGAAETGDDTTVNLLTSSAVQVKDDERDGALLPGPHHLRNTNGRFRVVPHRFCKNRSNLGENFILRHAQDKRNFQIKPLEPRSARVSCGMTRS